jgi:SAM-dependent methyltransferase
VHWTPVTVACYASKLLIAKPGTHVLDIGCGPGKFCLIAAALTDGYFTGIEQRGDLAKAATDAVLNHRIDNIEIIHGNVMDLSFSRFDAFYLFNPFGENMPEGQKIDGAVPLSVSLYIKCIKHVAAELCAKPIGTRVVTYLGCAHEVPGCYNCQLSVLAGALKLWIKVREAVPNDEHIDRLLYRGGRIATGRVFSNSRKSAMERGQRGQRI